MANETEIPNNNVNDEVAKLRQANRELIEKKSTLKARVAELEAESVGFKTRAETAETKLNETLINVPLRKMADSIAVIPKLWQQEFLKHYSVGLNDKAELQLLNLDGSPLVDADKKPVPFEVESLRKLLYDDQPKNSYLREVMGTLLIGSRGSGGGAVGSSMSAGFQPPAPTKKKAELPTISLGLR